MVLNEREGGNKSNSQLKVLNNCWLSRSCQNWKHDIIFELKRRTNVKVVIKCTDEVQNGFLYF